MESCPEGTIAPADVGCRSGGGQRWIARCRPCARGVVGVLPEKDAAVTPLRSRLVLATLLMAARS
ncbi:MAG: hypothetical protein HPM95_07995 [Alphaproteobacteria bacterium]|nr:hypothetical protein [Alphaproteobacteria bacterium]